jgi:hypothetical protein
MSIEILTVTASEWLETDLDWSNLPLQEIKDLVQTQAQKSWPKLQIACNILRRRMGDDPRPDLDPTCTIIEVFQWLKLVAVVTDISKERALSDIPASVRAKRKVGDPWYEVLYHIVLPRIAS